MPSDHKEIKSILASLGLKQLISTPTRITGKSKTLKDIICSNEPEKINSVEVILAGMRNSGTTIALPKVKLDFARKSFYFLGASTFNSLPLKIKQTSSRELFREFLDQFFV